MIILIGESASGKSSLAKYIADKFCFNNIVTYTTRKPRESEIEGVDYHFISESQFQQLKREGFFAETAEYNGWYYGSAKEDYFNSKSKIAVLTPHGIRQIKKNGINDIYTVYIKIARRDRLIKILQRGDNIEEAYRRSLSDVGQFDGIEDEADLIIENDRYKKSIKEIAYFVHYKYCIHNIIYNDDYSILAFRNN